MPESSTAKTQSAFKDPKMPPQGGSAGAPASKELRFDTQAVFSTILTAENRKQLAVLKNKHPRLPFQNYSDKTRLKQSEVEKEFKILRDLSKDEAFWKGLRQQEKVALEKYKLALMKAVEAYLEKRKPASGSLPPDPPKKKTSPWHWLKVLFYGALFLFDSALLIWTNYDGLINFAGLVPGLASSIGFQIGSGIVTSVVELAVYFSMMSPLFKKSLDIANKAKLKSEIGVYGEQTESFKRMKSLMQENNSLSARQYQSCANLLKQFYENLDDLKDFQLFLHSSLKGLQAEDFDTHSLIIVDKEAYFIQNKKFLKKASGERLSVKLSLSDSQLDSLKRACDESGRVHVHKDLESLVDKVRAQALSQAKIHFQPRLPPYREGPFKKCLHGLFTGISLAFNIAGGFAFALFLAGGALTAATFLSTPLGICIFAAFIIGQIALQFIVRNESLFDMLNPNASRHQEIRNEVNAQSSPHKRLDEKKVQKENQETLEKEDFIRRAKKNPHINDLPLDPQKMNIHRLNKPLKKAQPVQPDKPKTPSSPASCRI